MARETRKIDPEQARAAFKPGLYRHHGGGLYLATGLIEHHETRDPYVAYIPVLYGKHVARPLAKADEDSWSDHVEWPAPPFAVAPGQRHWPYGSWAPRYTYVPPMLFLLLVNGPPGEGAAEVVQLARGIEFIETSQILANVERTIAILKGSLKAPVVPVWVANADHPPPEHHVRVLNGSREFLLGQLQGILACVDPAGPVVETAGPPIVETP